MTHRRERERNFIDVVTHSIVVVGSMTAVTVVPANENRIWLHINFGPDLVNAACWLRDYAAATDNIKQGDLIFKAFSGNNSAILHNYDSVPDNPYIGEVSAIAESGSFSIYIKEMIIT